MPDEAVVVDADGHTMEPDDLWAARMDRRRWGDWIPRKVVEDDVYEIYYAGGAVRGGGRELQDAMAAAVGMTPKQFHDMLQSLRVPGGHDPDARVGDMDRDGIDVAVVYPSTALFFGPADPIDAFHDVEFVLDCQRAYNDWVAEYCAAHPRRLFAMGAVPLQTPDLAVVEAERAVQELGLQGVFVRPSAYVDELPLNHAVYDRFWAACQKFRLVAESENMMITNMAMDELHGGSGLGQAVGNTVDMVVTIGRLLMGGVCERFPRLRFLFLESGGGWMPTQLERMDEQVKAFPLDTRWVTLLPSEYFGIKAWTASNRAES